MTDRAGRRQSGLLIPLFSCPSSTSWGTGDIGDLAPLTSWLAGAGQKIVQLKEVRMQPKIEKHDLEFKVKHIQEFLEGGDKIKVTIRFRGREMAHPELGRKVLDRVLVILEDVYLMESPPKMEGRFMSMVITPKLKK